MNIKISVLTELQIKKNLSWRELWLPQNQLSDEALDVLNGAYHYLTGMQLGVNEQWYAESMTEAICFAEAEGL